MRSRETGRRRRRDGSGKHPAQPARNRRARGRRRALAARYARLLADLRAVTLPAEPAWARSNWQSYCVRLAAGLDQRTVMERLLAERVSVRRGVMCAHREPAYPPGTWRSAGGLEESERAQDRTIVLPLFPALTEDAQDAVVAALRRACA